MAIIKIDVSKTRVDPADAQDYLDVLNGISWDCQENDGYSEGYRNQVALNLTVACYLLGLSATDVLETMIINGIIDPWCDDEIPYERVTRALEYRYRFDWDYMIDPDTYLTMNSCRDEKKMKVIFMFEDSEL